MNVIDRAIEWMAPEHALRRMDARNRLQMIRRIKNSGYDESAASRKKNYGRGWNPANKSPQEDIDKNLPTLRARSRSLVTSAPLATSAIRTNRTNIVGSGIRPAPKIDFDRLNLSEEEAQRWQKNTQREFNVWAVS